MPSAYMTERLNFSSLASSNVGVLRLYVIGVLRLEPEKSWRS